MFPRDLCLSKAEECELHAAEARDPDTAAEWLLMAEEWRMAAGLHDGDSLH